MRATKNSRLPRLAFRRHTTRHQWLIGTVAALLLLATATVAFETARMALPDGFEAATQRIAVTGIGGRNRGQYQLDVYSGDYTRIESRWAVFDPLFAASRGKSSYTLGGPGFDSIVSAECGMQKNTVSVGVVTFDPKKMTYQCSFRRAGLPIAASFVLGHPKPDSMKARVLARADRRGVAMIDGVQIIMRSTHAYSGTRIMAPAPVGYLLEHDDRVVGAIELTDVNPTIFLPVAETAAVRQATLLTALALAVLRDPENSSLGD